MNMEPQTPARDERLSWGRLYSEPELYKAAVRLYTKPLFNWRKALSTSQDQRTLYDFARRGLKNLDTLHRQLVRQRFHFRPGLALHHNFNGKHRTLYVYPWEERLVDLLLYRLLNVTLHATFSPHSYAYRITGWGVDVCQQRVARAVRAGPLPLYVLKRDIRDYFASIDHATLRSVLADAVQPRDYLMALLEARIRFAYLDGGVLKTAERGVPFGTAIACCFANLYLHDLDRRLGALPHLQYFRYADDLLLLTPDPDIAKQADAIIVETLDALKLQSKPSHELNLRLNVAPRAAPDVPAAGSFVDADRFRYLGLEFRASGVIGLSRDKSRKICNLFRYAFRRKKGKFKQMKDPRKRAALGAELARKVLDDGIRNVAVIDYYLKHVQDVKQLALMDRWLAEEVLSLAFGGGHRKGYFDRISYAELRAMGLPSLVHRQREIQHGHIESPFFTWKNRNTGTARR